MADPFQERTLQWASTVSDGAADREALRMLERLAQELTTLARELERAYADGWQLLQHVQAGGRPDLLRNAAHLQVRLEGLQDQIHEVQELVERLWRAGMAGMAERLPMGRIERPSVLTVAPMQTEPA